MSFTTAMIPRGLKARVSHLVEDYPMESMFYIYDLAFQSGLEEHAKGTQPWADLITCAIAATLHVPIRNINPSAYILRRGHYVQRIDPTVKTVSTSPTEFFKRVYVENLPQPARPSRTLSARMLPIKQGDNGLVYCLFEYLNLGPGEHKSLDTTMFQYANCPILSIQELTETSKMENTAAITDFCTQNEYGYIRFPRFKEVEYYEEKITKTLKDAFEPFILRPKDESLAEDFAPAFD